MLPHKIPHRPICDGSQFWACPINVDGLDHESIEKFVSGDLYDILQPTLSVANDQESAFQTCREIGPLRYGRLNKVAERRVADLTKFLRQVGLIVDSYSPSNERHTPIEFWSLAGDSHSGGKRPLVLQCKPDQLVLKFTDPRPYQLLSDVLVELSDGISADLVPPEIFPSPNHQWYFMPYLEADNRHHSDVEAFMFSVGALVAVAYSLRLVDLHLENLLIFDGKPIIIDPECILYSFAEDNNEDRLLSTGLLSHNPGLSALRGGDLSKQELFQIGLRQRNGGILDYRKPVARFHNRLLKSDGSVADPSQYRRSFLGGFIAAFEWFLKNQDLTLDIVSHWAVDDFRIRFLVRKTRFYATVIHMLNFPIAGCYEDWRDNVLQRFRMAGHFPNEVSDDLVAAESADLEARDIPYFWVNAGEPVIRHRTGAKQKLVGTETAKDRTIRDIKALCRTDLGSQIRILNTFLDADLSIPSNDS